jgi:hypothetical protein
MPFCQGAYPAADGGNSKLGGIEADADGHASLLCVMS